MYSREKYKEFSAFYKEHVAVNVLNVYLGIAHRYATAPQAEGCLTPKIRQIVSDYLAERYPVMVHSLAGPLTPHA